MSDTVSNKRPKSFLDSLTFELTGVTAEITVTLKGKMLDSLTGTVTDVAFTEVRNV